MKIHPITLVFILCLALAGRADEIDNQLKAFPPAGPGMTRHVLRLPAQADEEGMKVELLVGKSVLLDKVNRYFFAGKIEEVTIDGWGFTRHVVNQLGPMAGSRMGVDPAAPKVNRFVTLGGGPHLVRYNSKLPLVVYVPGDAEVRYRIWSASGEAKAIDKG